MLTTAANARRAQERLQILQRYVAYVTALRQDRALARSCALVRPQPFVLAEAVAANPAQGRVAAFLGRIVAWFSGMAVTARHVPHHCA